MPDFGISRGAFLAKIFQKAKDIGSGKGKGSAEAVVKMTSSVIQDVGPVCKIYDPKWDALFEMEF